jgi:hypothetical protein
VLMQVPGLGIELNEEALGRYTLRKQERIPDGVYSDMVVGRGGYTPVNPDQQDEQETLLAGEKT